MTKSPNAILRRIRSSVATLNENSPAATPPDVHELIQAVKDLDNHLSWGGTPPDDWSGAPFAPSTKRGEEKARVHRTGHQTTAHQIAAHQTAAHEPHPVEDIIRRM